MSSSSSSSGAGGGTPAGMPLQSSMARASTSNLASTEENISSANEAYYASWEQSLDIRADVASGWGWGDTGLGVSGGSDRSLLAAPSSINGNSSNMDQDEHHQWGWKLQDNAVNSVPAFYPMDSLSTRRIVLGGEFSTTEDISSRISTACQSLSIHGVWANVSPTATLCSMELVEMEVNIYLGEADATALSSKGSPQVLLVEVQRRKGCPITFHNYRRVLLDAAEGTFDPDFFHETDGLDKPFGRDRCNQPRASLSFDGSGATSSRGGPSISRPSFASRAPAFSADAATNIAAGLKSEGETPEDCGASSTIVFDKAMKALNMAASLIRKDRIDARRVGIESLILLTDPLRAGMETAKIASQVVLLGSAHEENADDADALFDVSSGLGIRETILEMIMADDVQDSMTDDADGFKGIEKEFTDSLTNLCLTVLSNALHTVEESAKNENRKQSASSSPRRRAATEPAVRPSELGLSKRFIDDTNSTFGCDVLSSLLSILGQAKTNPHDAYHSARCLGVLFKGCGNSHKARARRDLDAKRIISAALEVGTRTHAKLADATRQAMTALVTDDEQSMEEEEQEEQMELADIRQEAIEPDMEHSTSSGQNYL